MIPTCASIFSSWSMTTPRSTTLDSNTIPGKRSSSSLSIFASFILVPFQIHWVLLGFSFRRLDYIQSLISERVLWSLRTASVASFALQCLYACVSSAYCWTPAPAPPTICRTSAMKSTYNNGPRTDPCGTPMLMTRHSDWRLPVRFLSAYILYSCAYHEITYNNNIIMQTFFYSSIRC